MPENNLSNILSKNPPSSIFLPRSATAFLAFLKEFSIKASITFRVSIVISSLSFISYQSRSQVPSFWEIKISSIFVSSKPEYSLNFKSTLNKNDFLNLEIGQKINRSGFIDEYDVVVGENGTFYLNSDFNFKINRYVPHSFLLILSVRTDNTYIYIENEFKLK